MVLMPDQHVESADRFLHAGTQYFVPFLKQGIGLGHTAARGFTRTHRALDPAQCALKPRSR